MFKTPREYSKTSLTLAIKLRNQPRVSDENFGRISYFEFPGGQSFELSVLPNKESKPRLI